MKRTPWFPGDVKPVHVGPYERRGSVHPYSFWNGIAWGIGGDTPPECCDVVGRNLPAGRQDIPWRGLTERAE